MGFNLSPLLEMAANVGTLFGGLAALFAAYVAWLGLGTWRSQLAANRKYPKIWDLKENLWQLRTDVISLMDKVYAYGYRDEFWSQDQKDQLNKKIDTCLTDSEQSLQKLEACFEHNNSQDIKAINVSFRNIVIEIKVYKKQVQDHKVDLVAHETLAGFLDYIHEALLSPSDKTKIEASENALWVRKERIENRFSRIFDQLTKLENNI